MGNDRRSRYDRLFGRNDRGAVLPPERVRYQGGSDLDGWFHGHRFGNQVSACSINFNEDLEIASLAGVHIQAAAVATRVPAIAMPQLLDATILEMMQQGCFLRLAPQSGFPALLLRDGSDPMWHGNTQADPRAFPQELVISKAGIWCPPCKYPMILPPTERYVNGYGTAEALYPIGGWVSNTDSGYLRWETWIEASSEPFNTPINRSVCWSGCFTTQLLTAGADKFLFTPLFPLWESHSQGSANQTLCGTAGVRAPSNISLCTFDFRSYAYDRDTQLGTITSGVINDQGASWNLTKEMMTAYCWLWVIWADYQDPNEADVPALTHFQVTL